MKIKLNNQIISKLNEDNAQTQQDQGTQTNSTFNAFEADAEYQYIMQRKREALPVSVILPQKFDLPVKLPTPPEDISNIMSSYQNNKARKTKNIGGVMQDPISTFNHADACCRDAFGNFFGQAIKIQDNEKQRKVDISYIQKSSNESYNYNEFPILNESATAATAGSMIGTGIGSVLGEVLTGGIYAAAGLASTVGVQVAALGGAAYMLGYWGEELFGNVESGGISNDKVAAHLNAKSQNMIKPTPSEPQKYTDIVEAIGVYVKDILEAVGDVAGVINPDGTAKIDEISKFVSGFLNTISKKANEFIETHSKEIEEQKKLAQEKRENDLTKQANRSDKVKNFIQKSQNAWAEQAKGQDGIKDFVLLQKIQNAFESAVNSNNNKSIDLSNALDEGGWKGLKNKYNELYPSKSNNPNESINVNGERLNEEDGDNEEQSQLTDIKNEEHTTKHKIIIDAEKIYKTLLQEFEAKFREAFPKNIDGKKLPKYEETKEQMKALIEAADKSINSKIEQITKVQQGETGATGGLGQAARTFLMGHPLESNNLREVWSRHLSDLNMRMTNRLQQMTDTNNKTRTLGWTIQVCRTVVPEILARMLTYRYIYAMLSNEGFFSYDTKTMEADKQAFQNDKDVYVNLPKSKLIWILNNQCLDYTSNNQQILTADPTNGGWVLSKSENMPYAFFLVSKLYGSKENISTCAKLGQFISDIKSYVDEKDQVDQFLGTVLSALQSSSSDSLLTDSDPAKFEQLANLFKMSDDIKNLKGEISETYQLLKGQVAKIPQDHDKLVNIAKTLDLVSKNPRNIYKAYTENQGVIDDLIKKSTSGELDDKTKEEIKTKISEFFGDNIDESIVKEKNYNDVTQESIQNLLPNDQANDYYSSILYMYPLRGLRIWDDEGESMSHLSADSVKQVCKFVKALLPLEFSGILAYGLDKESEKESNPLMAMSNAWKNSDMEALYGIVNNENVEDFNSAFSKIVDDKNKKLHDALANGPFANLKDNEDVKTFNKFDDEKKNNLKLKLSNAEILGNTLSIHNFDKLIASIEHDSIKLNSIDAILSIEDIKLKANALNDKDVEFQLTLFKQTIATLMEVEVNLILDKQEGEKINLTDDNLKESINLLGTMRDNSMNILGAVEYIKDYTVVVDTKDKEKANEIKRTVQDNKDKFNKSYDAFKNAFANKFNILTKKKYEINKDSVNKIFEAFAEYMSVNDLINDSNLNDIFNNVDSEEGKKTILAYCIEVLKTENISKIMALNKFILAVDFIRKTNNSNK